MHCPRCSSSTAVIDSRTADGGSAVRRRRCCPRCRRRFTTFERREHTSLIVVKRDGTREPFSREKLERGIWLACTKRPVTQEQIQQRLNVLEEQWSLRGREVASATIGNDIMRALRTLDTVAYIRFASVHREFKDIEEFREEIGKISSKHHGNPPLPRRPFSRISRSRASTLSRKST